VSDYWEGGADEKQKKQERKRLGEKEIHDMPERGKVEGKRSKERYLSKGCAKHKCVNGGEARRRLKGQDNFQRSEEKGKISTKKNYRKRGGSNWQLSVGSGRPQRRRKRKGKKELGK